MSDQPYAVATYDPILRLGTVYAWDPDLGIHADLRGRFYGPQDGILLRDELNRQARDAATIATMEEGMEES